MIEQLGHDEYAPILPSDVERRVPILSRICMINDDRFHVAIDARGREVLATAHGFPIGTADCDRLIDALQAYRRDRAIYEANSDEISDPITESIYEAQERLMNFHVDEPMYGRPGFVYAVRASHLGYTKVGKSVRPEMRFKELRKEYGIDLWVNNVIPCADMDWAELYLHDMLSEWRVGGEWFLPPYRIERWLERITSITEHNIGIGKPFVNRNRTGA